MTTKRTKTKRKTEPPIAGRSPNAVDGLPKNVKRVPMNAPQRVPGGRKYLDRSR